MLYMIKKKIEQLIGTLDKLESLTWSLKYHI